MGRIIVLVITALFSFHTAFAQADHTISHDAARSSTASTKKSTIPLRGTLYRVDYRGHTCYLFGTVHVGQAAFYPLEPQVTHALSNAGKLVLEVDIRNTALVQQAIVRHGLYPKGQTIAEHLSADDLVNLKATLKRIDIPFDNVAPMKPWMLANLLIVQELARSGFPTKEGLEMYFLSIAEKQNKAVGELETVDYQLSLFDQLSEEKQQDYLRETLQDLSDGEIVKKSAALIDAWQRADSNAMETLKQEELNNNSASSRFIEETLLKQRNPGMANKIEDLLKSDKATFVAVGAFHLIGDNSVPSLLKQRGYQVTKLY